MGYSLAQLKRDAKERKLSAVLTVRMGEHVEQEDLPERMRGARKIVGANYNALFFEDGNGSGKTSRLDLPKAGLVEYTDDCLRIYSAGYREPNAAEQRVLDEWNVIQNTEQYKKQAEIDALSDGSTTYWQQVGFFRDKGMEYLMGFEKQGGLSLDFNRRNRGEKAFIRDESIRGEVALEYRIERERTLEEQIRHAEKMKMKEMQRHGPLAIDAMLRFKEEMAKEKGHDPSSVPPFVPKWEDVR